MKAFKRTLVILCAGLLGGGCAEELVGATPELSALDPSLVCAAQFTTSIEISGAELSPLAIDAATDDPRLAIPDVSLQRVQDLNGQSAGGAAIQLPNDPSDPQNAVVRWTSSTSMAFDVYPELGLAPGLYEITVTNRNGRSATLQSAIAVVPEPALAAIEPDLMCVAQGMRTATITGQSFLRVGDELPTVEIGAETFVVDGLDDCTPVPGPTTAELCTTATVTVPQDALTDGSHALLFKNPSPAGCDSSAGPAVTMATVPAPSVTAVEPQLLCNEQNDLEIVLSGSGYVVIRDGAGDIFPTVTVGGTEIAVVDATNCAAIDGTLLAAESCNSLTATVPISLALIGDQDVVVTNPDPAGCSSEEAATVHLIAAPAIAAIEPVAICDTSQPTDMTVNGAGFLRIDNGAGGFIDPEVSVNASPVVPTFDPNDCIPVVSAIITAEVCTSFTFPVPQGGFALGDYTLTVTNPAPADCSDAANFTVASTPTITDVTPPKVCSSGDMVTVTGTGFIDGAEILVGGTALATQFVNATELTGTIPNGFPAGAADVTVVLGGACESAPYSSLIVVDEPVVFYVDPPNIYNGVDFRLTIWAAGLEGLSPQIALREVATGDIYALDNELRTNARVQGDLASGLPAGSYDVIVTDDPCITEALGVVSITDQLTLTVSAISPGFTAEGERTGVVVTSAPGDFAQTPRVYLTPEGGGTATELQATQWTGDATRLEGVVPGLPPGNYDVFVINPDGAVGQLGSQQFRVLPSATPPPEIANLDPGQIERADGVSVSILGTDFPSAASDLDIQATCRDRAGNETAVAAATVTATSSTQIGTTWNMSTAGITAPSVCVVRVTNTAINAFFDFSALSVVNSSGNLANFIGADVDMNEGRRALAAAAMRMNTQSRYLFAIGGDSGDDGVNAVVRTNTVESIALDPFGNLTGAWTYQRNALDTARSFIASAVVGRYVYTAGGRTDTGVDDAVMRAYLLDPFEATTIDDLDLALGDGVEAGVGKGLWYYKVAAIMDVTDKNNPGGEALPSEPLPVRLPDLGVNNATLTLRWDHVPGAVKYRVYRTAMADGLAGTEVLLAEMDTMLDGSMVPLDRQEFFDNGTATPDTGVTPMPLGSLGIWHQAGTLTTAREGAGFVAVPDSVDPTRHFLYVMGGRDSTGAALSSIEWVGLTTAASNTQTLDAGGFDVSGAILEIPSGATTERWNLGAVYMDATKSTTITDDAVYVYALPGVDGTGNAIAKVTAFRVDVKDGSADGDGTDGDGSLSGTTDTKAPNNEFSGYGYVANHNYIHVMGGQNSVPSAGGKEAFMSGTPPALANFNAGTSLAAANNNRYGGRYLCGTAVESAFIFLLGGETPNSFAEETVEQTNF